MERFAFGLPDLECLSHTVSKDGLKADTAKFKAVQEWLQLSNLGEVQFFVGMENYHSKFVTYFVKIAALLYKLFCKDAKWIWSSKHMEAIHGLQKAHLI